MKEVPFNLQCSPGIPEWSDSDWTIWNNSEYG